MIFYRGIDKELKSFNVRGLDEYTKKIESDLYNMRRERAKKKLSGVELGFEDFNFCYGLDTQKNLFVNSKGYFGNNGLRKDSTRLLFPNLYLDIKRRNLYSVDTKIASMGSLFVDDDMFYDSVESLDLVDKIGNLSIFHARCMDSYVGRNLIVGCVNNEVVFIYGVEFKDGNRFIKPDFQSIRCYFKSSYLELENKIKLTISIKSDIRYNTYYPKCTICINCLDYSIE